jgi:hypothetical protein
VEALALQPAHDLGERGDVAGDGVQVWAAGQDLLELLLVVAVEAVRLRLPGAVGDRREPGVHMPGMIARPATDLGSV